MKLSTRSRYGVRMMVYLAVHWQTGPVQLRHIAEKEGISEKYLGQIVIPLRNRHLIDSVRGAQGGYLLAREPSKITLEEVVECLEGSLYPVDCSENEECERLGRCATLDVWCELGKRIREYLASVTLEDLVNQYSQKNDDALSYII